MCELDDRCDGGCAGEDDVDLIALDNEGAYDPEID